MKGTIYLKSKTLVSIVGRDKIETEYDLFQTFSNEGIDFVLDASKYNIDEQELLDIINDWAAINKDDLIFLFIKNLPEELKQKQILYSIKQRVDDTVTFEGQKEYEELQQFDMELPDSLKEGMKKYFGRDKFSYIDAYRYSYSMQQTISSTDELEFWANVPNPEVLQNMLKKIKLQDKSDLPRFLEILETNKEVFKNLDTIIIDDMSIFTTEQVRELSEQYGINNISVVGEFVYKSIPARYNYTIDEYVELRGKIDDILTDIDMSTPEIERFLAIYKKLGKSIVYARDADGEPSDDDEAHNLKGGLLDGKCVCEGYALILKQVLRCAGIECRYVEDEVDKDVNDPKNKDARHAWNQVKIDGEWYNCDLTWDSSKLVYENDLDYCLQSDEDFILHKIDHTTQEQCLKSYDRKKINQILYKNKDKIKETRKFLEWYFKGQSLLQIDDLKERCLKYGLDFEEEMNKAKNKVELQMELDKTKGEIPEDKKEYFTHLADEAKTDLFNESLDAWSRDHLRSFIKEHGRNQSAREYISDECESLGLNYNYEIIGLHQNHSERKIAILPQQIGSDTARAGIGVSDINQSTRGMRDSLSPDKVVSKGEELSN